MNAQPVYGLLGFFTLKQNEIGVKLTLGKFSGYAKPGLGFAFPLFQKVYKTVSSLQTIDLPDQQIVLSGNISVTISGNLNFRVVDPQRALLKVSNYSHTMGQLALTTISDILGTKTIEEVRTSKNQIADEIEAEIEEKAGDWGLADIDIRLTDAQMDESLLRAMMRETEAEKEASAIRIKAEADRHVATLFSDAARTLAASPGAMTLRVMQTLSDVSNDKSTVIMPIPIDLLNALGGGKGLAGLTDAIVAPPTPEESKLVLRPGGELIATCPYCDMQYNVGEIVGKAEYDDDPNAPGQQVNCESCGRLFTLPNIVKEG